MSDDGKNQKDQGAGNGTTGDQSGNSSGTDDKTTTVSFGELMGQIDTRIESVVRRVMGGKSSETDGNTGDGTKKDTPESVAQQVRNELAKLNSEEAEKKKQADQEVTINELKEQVTKLSEGAPVQEVSKLTQVMWGGRKKKAAS